jgi:hypothetical protein
LIWWAAEFGAWLLQIIKRTEKGFKVLPRRWVVAGRWRSFSIVPPLSATHAMRDITGIPAAARKSLFSPVADPVANCCH